MKSSIAPHISAIATMRMRWSSAAALMRRFSVSESGLTRVALDADDLRLFAHHALFDGRASASRIEASVVPWVISTTGTTPAAAASFVARFCMIASSEIIRSPKRAAIAPMAPGRSTTDRRM